MCLALTYFIKLEVVLYVFEKFQQVTTELEEM